MIIPGTILLFHISHTDRAIENLTEQQNKNFKLLTKGNGFIFFMSASLFFDNTIESDI